MSTPRKHHYVSVVLTKNFVDDKGRVPYYDKTGKFHARANSPASIFWEYDLNTTLTKEGTLDYTSVEHTLTKNFEQHFPHYYKTLVDCLKSDHYTGLIEAQEYLMNIALIGNFRTREHQIETEAAIFGSFLEIATLATNELRESIQGFIQSQHRIKNKMGTDLKDLSNGIRKHMGEVVYSIFRAPDDDYFLLPDCTSAIHRTVLEDDVVVDGKILRSLAEPISTVSFPISPKIVLVAQAAKICPQSDHGIYDLSADMVYNYNKLFYQQANNRIACSDRSYLNAFISKLIGVG